MDELVKRSERRIEAFRTEHGLERAGVSVELLDGALHRLASLSAEPGYGFSPSVRTATRASRRS